MKLLFNLVKVSALATLLASCTVAYDGVFEQREGKYIDQSLVDRLIARQAARPEMIDSLGVPTQVRNDGDGLTVAVYVSVRERVSFEKTLGIKHSESKQVVEDKLEIVLKSDRVSDARRTSKIR